MVDSRRMSAGKWFHAYGAATEKDLRPKVVWVRCILNSTFWTERRVVKKLINWDRGLEDVGGVRFDNTFGRGGSICQ